MTRKLTYLNYLKQDLLPTQWCPGCGNGIVLKLACQSLEKLNFPKKGTVVVSGIGCAGRSAGFFNLDSVHTAHGRAIPVAEGIKLANEKLNVIVISGDGDLLGIGGNHLLHASRRNTDISIICIANAIYGMTGGQYSPTTELGSKTLTTPSGNTDTPIDVQALIKAHNCFYARSTTYHLKHAMKCMVEALKHRGLSFAEIKTQCITNDGRRRGFKNGYEMLMYYKDNYKINNNSNELKHNEIGIVG
ncbi:MAG TPA: 2-oxoacid:ferredoxin oxidoreductase subunit beta [Candidatus Scalindua sp.]|nr:2-oxoacid:ferredoxin oxidoreductase subunit beta [Candidatus Scalindua sp.]